MSFALVIIALLALAGLPLFLALAALALLGYYSSDQTLVLFFGEFIRLAENPTLVAIPLFTLAGYILAESRASQRLVRLAAALLGWLPGGLAVVVLILMALFTAFTGASGVSIVALGGLMLPSLLRAGYREKFALGLITSSGSIGLLFAPSLPLIIYGVVSETPINQLFIAGILPGMILMSGMIVYSIVIGIKHKPTIVAEGSGGAALKDAAWELFLPFLVIGGIYTGFFTVTEAAAVTLTYLFIVEFLIKRDLSFQRDMFRILRESSILIGGILLILGAALALTNVLVYLEVPMTILAWIKSVVGSRIVFLLLLNVFLLMVGCLMDMYSALLVIVPMILPAALEFGVHPLHLGIIFLANLEIGYTTPPVGLNLFIAGFRFQKPILKLYRAALPFLIIQLITLLLITYIPWFTLFPVKMWGGGR
ncbi:MAG: TRAP transporter large permease subunit [Calditrichota bacterium]